MTELSSIVGERILEIVPKTIRHPLSSDADGVLFTLSGTTYLVFEDPSDGYRSQAAPVLSYEGAAYQIGSEDYAFPDYIREEVICSHRVKGEHGDEEQP